MTTVLLVDDDEALVERNAAALAAAGYGTETAATAADALGAIRRTVPDAVVLEGILDNRTTGFELAQLLAVAFPDLPLLMLTRADDVLTPDERARQDRDGGWLPVHRFLEKPVMPEVLADEVGHLLHDHARTPASAAR